MSDDSTRDDLPSPSVPETVDEPERSETCSEVVPTKPPADAWVRSGDSLLDELPADDNLFDGDAADEDASADELPLAYIHEAVKKQNTPAMVEELTKIAERACRRMRKVGIPTWPRYGEGLVYDLVGAIWVRDVKWNPDRRSLFQRIAFVIKQQSWNEIQAKQRHPHEPIGVDGYDPDHADQIIGVGSLSRTPEGVFAMLLEDVLDELEGLAPDNPNVRAVLSCWRALITTQEEIAARTGLTAAECKAVRQQIMRLVAKLPQSLRTFVHEMLEET